MSNTCTRYLLSKPGFRGPGYRDTAPRRRISYPKNPQRNDVSTSFPESIRRSDLGEGAVSPTYMRLVVDIWGKRQVHKTLAGFCNTICEAHLSLLASHLRVLCKKRFRRKKHMYVCQWHYARDTDPPKNDS